MPITAPAKVRISPKAVRTVGSMTPIGGTKKAAVMRKTPKQKGKKNLMLHLDVKVLRRFAC